MPAALLKCQSRKRTRLPCLPPARFTLVQAEAELSFCPLPRARVSTGLGKTLGDRHPLDPRNVFQLPGDIKSSLGPLVSSSFLLLGK